MSVLPHKRLRGVFAPRPHDEIVALGFTFSSFKKFAAQFFVKRSATKIQFKIFLCNLGTIHFLDFTPLK